MKQRATWRLTTDCDNACVFCAQAGPEPSDSSAESPDASTELRGEGLREALARLRADADELTFIGGEPGTVSELGEAIAAARELGFSSVGLQTNARAVSRDHGHFSALVDAGLSDLHLSIHGPEAGSHDYHTGRSGSFAATMELLDWGQRAGLTCVVTTVITRSNFRELAKLPRELKRRGVAGWLLEVVRPYGRSCSQFSRVIPRFGMALPYTLHALEQSRRHALSAWIRGAPTCALGPFARMRLPEAERVYSQTRCEGCQARASCCGVDPAYLEIFGDSELRPSKSPPAPAFDAGRERLMRMFVGVGERIDAPLVLTSYAPKSPPEPEPTPADSKRRLPVLQSES